MSSSTRSVFQTISVSSLKSSIIAAVILTAGITITPSEMFAGHGDSVTGYTLRAGFAPAIEAAFGPMDDAYDPERFVQKQELTAGDIGGIGDFGNSVALSSDGRTALMCAPIRLPVGACYIFTRHENVWSEQQVLTTSDADFLVGYVTAAAFSRDGRTIIIGTGQQTSTTGLELAGAAYVFTRQDDGWTEQQKLTAPDPAFNDQFGSKVALSADGHTALVSAYFKNSITGAVYVFRDNADSNSGENPENAHKTYTLKQELTDPSPAFNLDAFGIALAVSRDGHTVLIGASDKNSVGAAYVFKEENNTYTQQQELTASDANLFDFFGDSVALSADGHVAVIGASNKSTAIGAAYVFRQDNNSYMQVQELTASDAATNTGFGNSVALSSDGNTALIGVGTCCISSVPGAAYVFTQSDNAYIQQQELSASNAAGGDGFGASVALDGKGDTALIGAPYRDMFKGAAYVFRRKDDDSESQKELDKGQGLRVLTDNLSR